MSTTDFYVDSKPVPSYFTCTLGHARLLNETLEPAPYNTINQFIEYLAQRFGNATAVACARPGGDDDTWIVEALSFSQIHQLAKTLATSIREKLGDSHAQQTIAFYASSSLTYLAHLLACFWSGWPVALISTACSSDAVRHLLKACKATAVLFDKKHEHAVEKVLTEESDFASECIAKIYLEHESVEQLKYLRGGQIAALCAERNNADDIILYGHSSGTSTGLPKPIPITHQDEIGVLPRYHQATNYVRPDSTLSTTPIYTGGLADLWRSWSAGTTLWTYPEHQAPITAENIRRYETAAAEWIRLRPQIASPIRFISCVPYVVQMLTEDKQMMQWLRTLTMIGVGGAAMPTALGDKLVANEINLVSRFGSRECGFLLSSDRNFSQDKDWQYVRHSNRIDSIIFQKWGDSEHELIVTENWPSLSPAIRDKLPFNSHDVFVRHKEIEDAWKYNGRSDVQITLRTGKKFDPAGIEVALTASEWIKDAVIVGNDQLVPAAIVFSSSKAEALGYTGCEQHVWAVVSELNTRCALHARLKRNMVAIRPSRESVKISKSSKGTIMRGKFDKAFGDIITALYNEDAQATSGPALNMINSESILDGISSIVKEQLGTQSLDPGASFYDVGVDSIMCLQIRRLIQAKLPDNIRNDLPVNILYDTGSLQKLSDFIGDLQKSHVAGRMVGNHAEDREKEMQNFLTQVCTDTGEASITSHVAIEAEHGIKKHEEGGTTVLLTGATGFLGSHLLTELVVEENVKEIICLLRKDNKDIVSSRPKDRIAKVLSAYNLSVCDRDWAKIRCLHATMHETDLGLEPKDLRYILEHTTQIIHAAWAVNFSLSLNAYVNQLRGLLNLYNLTKIASGRGPPTRLVFISSTAAILSAPSPMTEALSFNPYDSSSTGYGKSKWAAEKLLHDLSEESRLVHTSIIRVGQLTASGQTGAWNLNEAWPLMLDAGFHLLGTVERAVLPNLSKTAIEKLDWLPVNLAARSIKEILFDRLQTQVRGNLDVFHVLSDSEANPTWAQVKDWLEKPVSIELEGKSQQCQVKFIPARDWLNLLEDLSRNGEKHPIISLIPLWRSGWMEEKLVDSAIRFSTEYAQNSSKTMQLVASGRKVLTKVDFLTMLRWILLQHP